MKHSRKRLKAMAIAGEYMGISGRRGAPRSDEKNACEKLLAVL
jgi:hypothetical protein